MFKHCSFAVNIHRAADFRSDLSDINTFGEQGRIVVLSVPEGDDKPEKYPGTFAKADAVLINKIDLIDYIDFDIDKATGDIAALNPKAKIFKVCGTDGRGMEDFYTWLAKQTNSNK